MIKAIQNLPFDRLLSLSALKAFTLNVANQALGFVLYIILVRSLGVHEFGVFVLGWSWARIALNLSKFGFDTAANKFIPPYIADQDNHSLKAFITFSVTHILSISIAICAMGSALALLIVDQPLPYILALMLLPLWGLTLYFQAVLRAAKRITAGLIPDGILRPLLQIALVLALPALGLASTASHAMGVSLIAFACALAVSILTSRSIWQRPAQNNHPIDATIKTQWRNNACIFALIAGGAVIMKQADIVMIGALMDAPSAGFYAAATRIAMLATFILTAVNMAVGPMIAQLHAQNKTAQLQKTLSQSALLITAGTAVVVIAIWIAAPFILALFGAEFMRSDTALKILLTAQAINALSGPAGYVMTMTGHHVKAAQMFAIMIIANIALNACLIPLMGIDGAAWATGATTIIWNVILTLYVLKHLKLNTTILPLKLKR